ncbi:MAG: hypothetical protein AAF634_07425 [Bacteroidota bacterium]
MIATQRRMHLVIWILIAVVLPVVMLLAVKDLHVLDTAGNTVAEIAPLSVSRRGRSVTVQVDTPLKSAASIVYEMDADGNKGSVLGQLKGRGNYTFLISPKTKGIYIIDAIKNVELLKIEF